MNFLCFAPSEIDILRTDDVQDVCCLTYTKVHFEGQNSDDIQYCYINQYWSIQREPDRGELTSQFL